MESLSPDAKKLYELLKTNIATDLDIKLKEQQDVVVAAMGKLLDDRLQGLAQKIEGVREGIGQIRLERGKEVRPDVTPKSSSPPTPTSVAGSDGVVFAETLGTEKDKPAGLYVSLPIRGMRDANLGWNFSSPSEPNPRDSTEVYGPRPLVDFPRFDGSTPQLWQTRCEDYFQLWGTPSHQWISYAFAQFEGAAARWLESVQRQAPRLNWGDFCQVLPY